MNSWDERFSQDEYVYGKEPNDFLVEVSEKLPKGRVLSLGEGEGRNAVFMAGLGAAVTAVDQSEVGLSKTKALADKNGVTVETVHADLNEYKIEVGAWDAILIFFCHLPPALRAKVHRAAVQGLASGGKLVMEVFGKGQLGRGTGGPSSLDLLYDQKQLENDFRGLSFGIHRTLVRDIKQGRFHHGEAEVIQLLGCKSED